MPHINSANYCVFLLLLARIKEGTVLLQINMENIEDFLQEDSDGEPSSAAFLYKEEIKVEIDSGDQPSSSFCESQIKIKAEEEPYDPLSSYAVGQQKEIMIGVGSNDLPTSSYVMQEDIKVEEDSIVHPHDEAR
jgi:hypothetical protein